MNIGTYIYNAFEMFSGVFEKLSTFFSYTLGNAVSDLTFTSKIVEKLGLADLTMSSLLIGGGLLVLIVYSILK
jgi:hypothetical protein